ncbi:hypothetical protein D3C87_1881310 [compost metagenome]
MRKLGSPGAEKAGDAQRLAAPDRQRYVVELARAAQALYLEDDWLIRPGFGANLLVERLAGHQLGDARLRHAGGGINADQRAIAQHGNAA